MLQRGARTASWGEEVNRANTGRDWGSLGETSQRARRRATRRVLRPLTRQATTTTTTTHGTWSRRKSRVTSTVTVHWLVLERRSLQRVETFEVPFGRSSSAIYNVDLDTQPLHPSSSNHSHLSHAAWPPGAGGQHLILAKVIDGTTLHGDPQRTEGIEGEPLARREMQHLALYSEMVSRFRTAQDTLVGWTDHLDAKIVQLKTIIGVV